MTHWTPTEGMKRAKPIVEALEGDAVAMGSPMSSLLRWRMFEAFYKALDAALRDGSEADALASVVGNGKAGWDGDLYREASGNVTKVRLNKGEHEELPAVAEAMGIPVSAAYAAAAGEKVAAAKRRGRPKGSGKKAKAKTAQPEAATE